MQCEAAPGGGVCATPARTAVLIAPLRDQLVRAARRKKMAGDAMPLLLRAKDEQEFPPSAQRMRGEKNRGKLP
jgi:hypothetical protein